MQKIKTPVQTRCCLVSKITLILLLLLLSTSIQANKQQSHRKQFAIKNNINPILNLSKKELENSLKSSIPKFPKSYPFILEKRWQQELPSKGESMYSPKESMRCIEPVEMYSPKIQRLIHKLLYFSKGVQAINNWDKKTISSYISSKGESMPCIEPVEMYISPSILKKIFTQKNNIFTKKMLKTERFLKKNNNSRMIKYQTYNYLGPYIETYKTICNFDSKLKDKEILKLLKRHKCELKEELFKNITFKDLLNKISIGDKQIISKKYEYITPFVAKVILTEIILSKLNKKEQKEFYKKIINKTDYSEFTCGKFCNTKSHLFRRDTDLMIVHMGYQLLNSIKGANLLEKYTEILIEDVKPSKNDKEKAQTETIGIECSLFLQRAIERTNIAQIKGRMKTDYMDYSLVKHGIARKIILNYENQLKLGDIVKLHGHTYLFLGYKEIKNHYYAVTLEATGGSLRSVGIFYRDFYDEKLGSFNKKFDENNKIIRVDRNERYVIYRLR